MFFMLASFTTSWVFFKFLKSNKCYEITQSITYIWFGNCLWIKCYVICWSLLIKSLLLVIFDQNDQILVYFVFYQLEPAAAIFKVGMFKTHPDIPQEATDDCVKFLKRWGWNFLVTSNIELPRRIYILELKKMGARLF